MKTDRALTDLTLAERQALLSLAQARGLVRRS